MERLRVRQIKTATVIVHRRTGRAKIRSYYDRQLGYPGRWGILCNRYTPWGVNTTTKTEEVTCLTCLYRMGIGTGRHESQKQQIAV